MAGRTLPSSGTPLLEIVPKLQSLGFCCDLNLSFANPSSRDLSILFDRILSIFFEEIYIKPRIPPLPVMLGDGRQLDLFALYRAVSVKGGYSSVTATRSWSAIAGEIGMDAGVAASLKLVYVKYLDALERWLQKVLEKSSIGERKDMVCGLEKEVNCLLLGPSAEKNKECEATPGSASKKDQFLTPVRGSGRKLDLGDGAKKGDDDDENGSDDVVAVKETHAASRGFSGLKRKREDLVGMLNWVRKLAKKPGDFQLARISSDGGKTKGDSAGELFKQVIQTRVELLVRKLPSIECDSCQSQKGQRFHPSIYGDYNDTNSQFSEQKRCSERLRSIVKHKHSVSCSELAVIHDNNKEQVLAAAETGDKKDKHKCRNSSPDDSGPLSTNPEKSVLVGAFFQAEIPEWTGRTTVTASVADESKWLGTRIWPPKRQEPRLSHRPESIGKGRKLTCQCQRPGSVECVRFHVVEKRLQLKCELGSAFHAWRFHCMGEEVALSWTAEEEKRFKYILGTSLDQDFWDQLYIGFPSMRRQVLTSYYFNVYILRRRSYQNRMTPNHIDSDDEEGEFGFTSKPFGHEAVKVNAPKSKPKLNLCSQNAQCLDLDDSSDAD